MNAKGQSLLELVMVLPVMIALWCGLLWFAHMMIISIELMQAARHGIFWLAYNTSLITSQQEKDQVTRECLEFIRSYAPGLKTEQLHMTIQPGDRWASTGPLTLSNVTSIIQLAPSLKRLKTAAGLIKFRPASISIEYALETPRLFRQIPGFPLSIPLRGYCVCYR